MRLRATVLAGLLLAGLVAGFFLSRLPQANETNVPAIVLKQVTETEEKEPKRNPPADEREGQSAGGGARQGPLPLPAPAGEGDGTDSAIGNDEGATDDARTDKDASTDNKETNGGDAAGGNADEQEAGDGPADGDAD